MPNADGTGAGTVTVVIPTYNRPALLGDTVRSVLRQTRSPTQVIVVNDGGLADPREFLGPLAHDLRITVLTKENGGVASARNFGAAVATSDYILFLDDDDQLTPDALDQLASRLDDEGVVAAVGGAQILGADPDAPPWWLPPIADDGMYFDLLLDACVFPASAVMMRRRVFDGVGGYHEPMIILEDYDLWFRIAQAGRIANYQGIVLEYRVHKGSISRRPIQLKYALLVTRRAIALAPANPRMAGIRVRVYLLTVHLDDLLWSIRGDLRARRFGSALQGLRVSLAPIFLPSPSARVARTWWTIFWKNFRWHATSPQFTKWS
ncbi:MAG: glycosyltransferase family 2 protein [Gemmatimonadales bacterium]|nr:glycosyltransferase family 2 protein [Gemmatimonadales bacterium]